MRVCRAGYFAQIDRKEGLVRVWHWAGERVVAVIDLYKRQVIWAEEELEVKVLCDDIHITVKRKPRVFATLTADLSFSS